MPTTTESQLVYQLDDHLKYPCQNQLDTEPDNQVRSDSQNYVATDSTESVSLEQLWLRYQWSFSNLQTNRTLFSQADRRRSARDDGKNRRKHQRISSFEQLVELPQQLALRSYSNRPDFQFNLPLLSLEDNQQLSQRINDLKNDCGCFVGGLVMGLTLVGMLIAWLLFDMTIFATGAKGLLQAVATIFIAIAAGKLTGLLIARVRLLSNLERAIRDYGWRIR